MNRAHELKGLNTLLKKTNKEILEVEKLLKDKKRDLAELKRVAGEIKEKISNMGKIDVVVTEHCLLRFIEYKYNLDFERMRDEIVTERFLTKYNEKKKDGYYPIDNNLTASVREGKITTVLRPKGKY